MIVPEPEINFNLLKKVKFDNRNLTDLEILFVNFSCCDIFNMYFIFNGNVKVKYEILIGGPGHKGYVSGLEFSSITCTNNESEAIKIFGFV